MAAVCLIAKNKVHDRKTKSNGDNRKRSICPCGKETFRQADELFCTWLFHNRSCPGFLLRHLADRDWHWFDEPPGLLFNKVVAAKFPDISICIERDPRNFYGAVYLPDAWPF